jgi:ribosomal protein L32
MGQPKKRTSHRRTGARRSHLVQKLARRVNAASPVNVGAKRAKKPAEDGKQEAKEAPAAAK